MHNSYFLYPSALFVKAEPYHINTILGSCVAVCLFDPILQIGGMNHFMLPYWNGQGLASPKYGNIATEKLIQKMLYLGSRKANLQAKVFGGAEVLSQQGNHFLIGKRNIEVAKEVLNEAKIPIIASSTGGKLGRKIIFDTQTGEVKHRFVGKN